MSEDARGEAEILPNRPPPRGQSQLPLDVQLRYEEWRHTGFLVPPHILREYESIVPGSAVQIFEQARSQTNHRQQLELSMIHHQIDLAQHGQRRGFVLAFLAIIAGAVTIGLGETGWGFALIVGETAALVGVYVHGQRVQHADLRRKAQRVPDPSEEFRINEDSGAG